MDLPERQAIQDFREIEKRFGLSVLCHRVGDLDLRVAEVERVDDLVQQIYPGAVTLHGDAPVWMVTWPASLGLAEHLVLNEQLAGKRILELGCGTAAPGIAAERSGAALVVCTDYDPLAVELARHNARLNGCRDFEVRFLDWYYPDLAGLFDFIVGSEVAYYEKNFRPLLGVLCSFTAPGGRIVLADQDRPQMGKFLEMCKEAGFTWEQYFKPVHLADRSYRTRVTVLMRSS
jgi:predicted nicotinamide N-methyase